MACVPPLAPLTNGPWAQVWCDEVEILSMENSIRIMFGKSRKLNFPMSIMYTQLQRLN